MSHLAYIGVGANEGNPAVQVAEALRALGGLGSLRASSLYRTEPVGGVGQRWYVNAVAEIRTRLEAEPLFTELRALERAAGRADRRPSGAPRRLDLDLLLFDDRILGTSELLVPHPRLHERRFVLEPLAEIAPEARDPRSGRRAAELLRLLADRARVQRLTTHSGASGRVLGTFPEKEPLRRETS